MRELLTGLLVRTWVAWWQSRVWSMGCAARSEVIWELGSCDRQLYATFLHQAGGAHGAAIMHVHLVVPRTMQAAAHNSRNGEARRGEIRARQR
jgi:hypothetical protein